MAPVASVGHGLETCGKSQKIHLLCSLAGCRAKTVLKLRLRRPNNSCISSFSAPEPLHECPVNRRLHKGLWCRQGHRIRAEEIASLRDNAVESDETPRDFESRRARSLVPARR